MKKIIRWVDFLRPGMNLKHRGLLFEYTIFSGIVSFVSIVLIVASVFYFLRPLIWRERPTTNIYEASSQENYTYPINSSFYNHFVTFSDFDYNIDNDGLDLTYFRIIGGKFGLNDYELSYQREIELEDYWIYGKCDETDFNNIKEEEYEVYNISNCIQKYYNSQEKKYYDKNDANFKWPVLSSKGIEGDHDNNIFSIIIEKCHQKTLDLMLGEGYQCKNDSEIKDYIDKGQRVFLTFFDYDVNLDNYDKPNSSFWYSGEERLYNDFIAINKMTYSPSIITTDKGIIFNRNKDVFFYELINEDSSYIAKREIDESIYLNFNIKFNKGIKYYKRKYRKLQDIISQIGGFVNIIIGVAHFIVRYYNELKILRDVRDLISHYYNKEQKEKLVKNNSTNETQIELTTNNFKEMKDIENKDICKNESKNNLTSVNINDINSEKNNLKTNKNEININVNNQIKQDHNYNEQKKEENIVNGNIITNEIEKKEEKEENDEKSIFTEENKKFHICSYIAYRYTLHKVYKKYSIYNDFINRVFSVEQLIKNHIILYNLTHNRNPDTQIYSLSELLKEEDK